MALTISGVGKAVVRVTGTVGEAHAAGDAHAAQLEVDEDQRGLVRRLLEHLAGRADMPRARPPRYRLRWPALVLLPSGPVYMRTVSVSAGGCGLSWNGPRPRIGSVYFVRLGAGQGAPCLRAMACWVREQPGGARVGFRFVGGGENAKLELLLEQARPDLVTE